MDLFRISIDWATGTLDIAVSWVLVAVGIAIFIGGVVVNRLYRGKIRSFEIDEAEIGIGQQKVKFRPNYSDLQIAFEVWTELSTRKIAIPIDPDNDLIIDIYDSWYDFFCTAREMLKNVSVSQLRRKKGTLEIVSVLIAILNDEMRPHLTKWQARYRSWWAVALEEHENKSLTPQEIQKKYPQYTELMDDLIRINTQLAKYKDTLHDLIYS